MKVKSEEEDKEEREEGSAVSKLRPGQGGRCEDARPQGRAKSVWALRGLRAVGAAHPAGAGGERPPPPGSSPHPARPWGVSPGLAPGRCPPRPVPAGSAGAEGAALASRELNRHAIRGAGAPAPPLPDPR